MKKEAKKKLIIALVLIGILIILGIVAYFLIFNQSSMFSFTSPDFSVGAGAMDKISGAGNANAFESTKLNPFQNST